MGDGYDQYLLDLPYHGQTDVDVHPSFQGIIDFVQQWLKNLPYTGDIHLIGHSFGGRIMMRLDYTALPRVKSLVIEDISPEPMTFYNKDKLAKFFSSLPRYFIHKKAVEQFVRGFGFNEDITLLLMFHFRKDTSGQYGFDMDASALTTILEGSDTVDLWAGYRQIPLPLLIIKGERSPFLTTELLSRMQQDNKNARVAVAKGTGHWIHIEDPQQFCDVVGAFLDPLKRI